MKLVVWNSQGAKWNGFWDFCDAQAAGGDTVMGFLLESGWAPWVISGDVKLNCVYELDQSKTWCVQNFTDTFSLEVSAVRQYKAWWIPWVGNLDAMKTNSRCSLGGVVMPAVGAKCTTEFGRLDESYFLRPVARVRAQLKSADITIYAVHLISGYWRAAQAEMDKLTSIMTTIIPEGTPAIVTGDMNINLLKVVPTLPKNWRYLRTNGATQQSGGELDYALLYDPSGTYSGATASVVAQYKTASNGSDHSVMMYDL